MINKDEINHNYATSQDIIDKLVKAGKIAAAVRGDVKSRIVAGVSFIDIVESCEKQIVELGGGVAWCQISPTATAAHFSPVASDNPICKDGDLLKLDIGVHIDGYIADTAVSVCVGNTNSEFVQMIECAEEALEAAIKVAKVGAKLCDIGLAQETVAKKYGFKVIRNLSGHTLLPYSVHGGITIPAYDTGEKLTLTEGMVIAIEPFVTTGAGYIAEKGEANVFMEAQTKNTRSTYGRKLLPEIAKFKGLPFARKDFEKKFGRGVASVGIRELLKEEIIAPYPPLVEIANGPVAQAEHSLIIGKDGVIVYTR